MIILNPTQCYKKSYHLKIFITSDVYALFATNLPWDNLFGDFKWNTNILMPISLVMN